MAEAAAARATQRVGTIDVPVEALRRAIKVRGQDSAVTTPAPTENAIFKIIFAEDTTPEQSRSELAKYMTFPGTKEEAKERIRAYGEFEEWLQSERERMSKEIIKLTDTETFSELQSVYNDLNNALLEFDERMKPLTEIIDAIYVLRTNGKTMDAFQEIALDRKAEVVRKEEEAKKEEEFRNLKQRIGTLNANIATLGEEKTFFGFGGVTKTARQEIVLKDQQLNEAQQELDRLATDISALAHSPANESTMGEFTEQKAKLRELLDISSDTHKQRQRDLVDAALGFVEKAKDRIGSVREHLGHMTDQIDSLYDANTKMTGVYAVMSEGIKDATGENAKIRTTFQPPQGGDESLIAKMGREEKLGAVEDHIRALDSAAGSTIETSADLTTQTIRIKNMRDSNLNQIDKARRLHVQGVAGVADRLSVVLNAVSAAALGESSAMAKGTLEGMIDRTNQVAQKEVIQNALGMKEINRDIEKALADLGDYGEVLSTSTGMWRQSLSEAHENIERLRQLRDEVRGDLKEAVGVHADVVEGATPGAPRTGNEKPNGATSPFSLGKK